MKLAVWCVSSAVVFSLLLLPASIGSPPVPTQPIAFSHRLHAGDMGISCQYCHPFARRSAVAGVPSVERCMGCHELVAYEAEEVQKLTRYWEEREPIAWEKVYDLPDHSKFLHDRHVRREIDCSVCHGPVETMDQITLAQPLRMGWCIDCHRQTDASLDCLACHY